MITIPTSELKSRLNSGQIKLNGEPITLPQYRELTLDSAIEFGEWLNNHPEFNTIQRLSKIYDVDILCDTNSPVLQRIFLGKGLLRLSKKEIYIINKKAVT